MKIAKRTLKTVSPKEFPEKMSRTKPIKKEIKNILTDLALMAEADIKRIRTMFGARLSEKSWGIKVICRNKKINKTGKNMKFFKFLLIMFFRYEYFFKTVKIREHLYLRRFKDIIRGFFNP